MNTEHGWVDTPLGTLYFEVADGALREAGFVDIWARDTIRRATAAPTTRLSSRSPPAPSATR